MMPPTVLKLSKRSETAAAVAATTIEVMTTILSSLAPTCSSDMARFNLRRMSQGEKGAHGDRFLATRQQSPGHQVNCLLRSISICLLIFHIICSHVPRYDQHRKHVANPACTKAPHLTPRIYNTRSVCLPATIFKNYQSTYG